MAWKWLEIAENDEVTFEQIGERVGVELEGPRASKSTVRAWRSGTVPDPYKQRAIARVFGVEPWDGTTSQPVPLRTAVTSDKAKSQRRKPNDHEGRQHA